MKGLFLAAFAVASISVWAQSVFKYNELILGKGTDVNTSYVIDRAGSSNPSLRWNGSTFKWYFSHDGLTFEEFVGKQYVDSAILGVTIPDATSLVKGKIKLAGDLGGTADSPTVPGLALKEPSITTGTTSQYWRGDKTFQTLDKSAVGLGNVDNTSDSNKPISTAAQTALNAKVSTSGNESISGTKTFTGKIVSSSTSNGSTPCPVMTQTQRDAISSPSNGDCVFNSTSSKLNVYNSTLSQWKEVSGSSGSNSILLNSGFEDGTGSWTLSSGTAVSETTIKVEGEKSYKATLSSQTLGITQDSTTNAAQFNGTVQGIAYARVKTSLTGISVCSRRNGSTDTDNCVSITAGSGWVLARVPFMLNGTSNGIAIISSGNVTGDVYVDDVFVGMASDFDTVPSGSLVKNCSVTISWTSGVSSTSCRYYQNGEHNFYSIEISISGAVTATSLLVNLPSGIVIDTNKIDANIRNLTLGDSNFFDDSAGTFPSIGKVGYSTSTQVKVLGLSTGSSPENLGAVTSTFPFTFASLDKVYLTFKVPVVGQSATTNTYTDQCQSDVACSLEYIATIAVGGGVTSENQDWINGSCTNASPRVCTLQTNLDITTAMTCTVDGAAANASSTSSVSVQGNSATAILRCTKVSPDYKVRRSIVGVFKNVPINPGIEKTVRYKAYIAGASDTSSCGSSPCVIYSDPQGLLASAPTRSGTGSYSYTTNAKFAASSYVECRVTSNVNGASTDGFKANASGVISGASIVTRDSGGATSDSRFWIECEGSSP